MYKKLKCCKYCNLSFSKFGSSERANHSRWCDKNPKRAEYVQKNNGLQLQTPEVIAKRNISIKQAYADGKYDHVVYLGNPGYKHTIETKRILREKALASPHRRLIKSVRNYTKKNGTIVKLDSSWEEALAKRLDAINIEWVRPNPIKWVDRTGIVRNYFPDFYLPDYDIFLDPKNPYAVKAQWEKLNCLTTQVKNLIIIKSLYRCNNFTPDQDC